MKSPILVAITIGLTLLAASCSPRQREVTPEVPPAVTTEEGGDLMQQWRLISEMEFESLDYDRATRLAAQMHAQGEAGLEPLFTVLGDPEASSVAKMLAVICLTPYINEHHLSRLVALTDPEHSQSTRGCAIHLLSYSQDPDARTRILQLFDDADAHVSKVATLTLLRQGDATAVQRVLERWDSGEFGVHDRNEIVLGFPPALAMNHLELFTQALCDSALDHPTRMHAIQLVGAVGGAAVLPSMETCLEKEENPELKDLMEAALDAIKARDRDGLVAVPVALPPAPIEAAQPVEIVDVNQ